MATSKQQGGGASPSDRESGTPGGGRGRRDVVGESRVFAPGQGDVPADAEVRMAGSWGGGDYAEAGGSELTYREGALLGGLTAGPDGEPTIDTHATGADARLALPSGTRGGKTRSRPSGTRKATTRKAGSRKAAMRKAGSRKASGRKASTRKASTRKASGRKATARSMGARSARRRSATSRKTSATRSPRSRSKRK